jgi:glycosyltransferase involved in cell wall biosynthesis
MRILHSESSTGWGGQENRTLNELIGMRERGHEMAVVSRPGARILERAKEAGFETFAVDMRGALDFPALFKLRRLMREFRADIVNTHSGRDTQLAGMAARSMGSQRPRIVRTRHLALPITSKISYSVLPDQVVTVSRFVGEYLVAAGVPRTQITVVPTGIDVALYSSPEPGRLREELGLGAEAVLVGTVAILRKKKGHIEIIEAARRVIERFPNTHFVFAGDGPQADNLRRRIGELGLEGRIHLLGLRRDVINILKSLDLFVLPTYQEALGTAFIEAGATGCPVIGTAVDGVPEVVQDGVNGLLVPAKDSEALAEALLTMLADPARRHAMGSEGARLMAESFSRAAMAAGMEKLYLQLLAARP